MINQRPSPAANEEEELSLRAENDALRLDGRLDVRGFARAKRLLDKAGKGAQALDLSGLTQLDTAGGLLLLTLQNQGVELRHLQPHHQEILRLLSQLQLSPPPETKPAGGVAQAIARLGKQAVLAWQETQRVITFIGQTALALAALRHPRQLRLPSVARHIREIGVYAIPIIGLMAFMISIVLAYQGVAQLRPYGGERYTVNLVTLSLLREMGVLLTAIMVAGRSGSAFTAEIGVMKAREEVDALQVTGIAPFEMLVVPRMVALLIALPLLTFLADILGLFGGWAVSLVLLDMTTLQYIHQVHEAAKLKDFLVGMIKAPVFAFIIGIIGCMHGLRVSGSAESVGKETTKSVVKSIFLVLTLDAFFSIFFQKIGW